MMKLLFLIHNMSHGAGTERVLACLANNLTDRGIEADIVSCREGLESHFALNGNINLYSMEGEKEKNRILRKIKGIHYLRTLCRKQQYDFFICVDINLIPYTVFLSKKKMKVIGWEHFNYFANLSVIQKITRSYAARHADAVVVITKEDEKNYKENEPVIKRIEQIYNPIKKISALPDNRRGCTVLAVGRLEKQKGFDLLLEAWELVEQKNDLWDLKIIGEGKEKENLLKIIRNRKLKRASLCGYVEEIEKEYETSGMLVCSSRYEGFGMILVEAQNHGLPVISFDCPAGPGEIIEDGVNGNLVKGMDVVRLSEAILTLAADEKLRKTYSVQAYAGIDRFEDKKITDHWKKFLSSF